MRRGFWPSFLVLPGLWLLALYVVPLGFIAAVSVATTDFIGNPVYGWHTQHYHEVLSSTFWPPIWHSLAFAASAQNARQNARELSVRGTAMPSKPDL